MAARSRSRPKATDDQEAIESLLRTKIARLLQDEREARGWTQEHLAEQAGTHWTTIGKIERGIQLPSLGMLALLARALGLQVSEVCSRVLDEAPAAADEATRIVASMPAAERGRLAPVLKAMVEWRRGSR